jgi:hypothetical protein
MPPTLGLDRFYRRAGFEVGDAGAPIDLWVVFGVHSRIQPAPTSASSCRQAELTKIADIRTLLLI